MIQLAKTAASDRCFLGGQVYLDHSFKTTNGVGQADFTEVPYYIGLIAGSWMARELATECYIALVIEVELLAFERATGEKRRIAEMAGGHGDKDRGGCF